MKRIKKKTMLYIVLVCGILGGLCTVYAADQIKTSEGKRCVSVFSTLKVINSTSENWSSIKIFGKILMSDDIRGLANLWEIDYDNVKIMRFNVEHQGEIVKLIGMGIPLKDGKHIIVYYEFSKPFNMIKTKSILYELDKMKLITKAVSTNGEMTVLSSCDNYCESDSDCDVLSYCTDYCCSTDLQCVNQNCAPCAASCWCAPFNFYCAVSCSVCLVTCGIQGTSCCEEWGKYCESVGP